MYKYIIFFMILGCGRIDEKIDRFDRKFDQNFGKQSADSDKLVHATHVQVLSTSLEQMRLVDNLSLPVRMFPYAQTFTEEASAKEIIETCHVLLQDAKKSSVLHFKDRVISLNMVAALAGLTSQKKAEEIIKVTKGDYLEKTTYEWLTLRYILIRDAYLKPILETENCLKCKGKAADYLEKLKYIAQSPFNTQLQIVIPSLLVNKKVDPEEINKLGK